LAVPQVEVDRKLRRACRRQLPTLLMLIGCPTVVAKLCDREAQRSDRPSKGGAITPENRRARPGHCTPMNPELPLSVPPR
jgi:hypothetical protein